LEEHGLILGRYRPLSELGDGGHGTVDLAFDTKMTRRVAIKRIPLSHAGVRRLGQTTGLAEARTAALLNHPNIVTMYEWDTDEDEAYLIMEHVDGCSLADLLDAYSPLDADEAAAVLTPVCSALAFAHDNGVLHLDLKPENVLVTRDGLVKVADFGVASLTNAAGQAISAGGTLGYMPPEQLRGEAVDARTDSWALGALAYEVVTGSVPFAADSIEEALRKAEDVVPPMPGDIIGAVPREIDDIVMTALAADPDARFTSAAGFGAQLLAVLGDPQSGREALREMVAELVAEEEATAHGGVGGPGLWDRLAPYEPALLRVMAAVGCGWLGWVGLVQSAHLIGPTGVIVGAVLVAAAGASAPALGLAVGLLLAALSPGGLEALAALALGAAWWLLVGRRRPWAAMAPVFAPLLCVAAAGPLIPLAAGFFLPAPWQAAAAGAAAGLIAVWSGTWPALEPFSAMNLAVVDTGPFWSTAGAIATPAWWLAATVTVLGWSLAGLVMSLACRRRTRAGAVAGMLAGAIIMLAAAGPWVTGTQQLAPGVAVGVAVGSILMCVVIALGPPPAAVEDD
jgi:hypothetical protein